jgi:hypothetical protein
MFSYLARLYDNALKQLDAFKTEQIIRRGQAILAAVRLLAKQPHQLHSPAHGTDARNLSRVTVLGWKPYREIALAERVSERRRIRAMEARARAREQHIWSQRVKPIRPSPSHESVAYIYGRGNINSRRSSTEKESPAKEKTWAEKELENSFKRRAKSVARVMEELGYGDFGNSRRRAIPRHGSDEGQLQGDSDYSSDDYSGSPVLIFPRRSEIIDWNIPDYHEKPSLTLPFPINERNFTETESSLGDTSTLTDAVLTDPIISYQNRFHNPPPSESISPRSTPTLSPEITFQNSPEEPSSSVNITDSDHLASMLLRPLTSTGNRPLRASHKSRLRRFRSTITSVLPNVSRFPWSSDSATLNTTSRSVSDSTHASPSAEEESSDSIWSSAERFTCPTTINTRKQPIKKISLLSNRTLTLERVDAQSSSNTTVDTVSKDLTKDPNEILTRTEREYQELLEALQKLKRDFRLEREAFRKERARPRTRGRLLDRETSRGRDWRNSRSLSKETVRQWLGGIE